TAVTRSVHRPTTRPGRGNARSASAAPGGPAPPRRPPARWGPPPPAAPSRPGSAAAPAARSERARRRRASGATRPGNLLDSPTHAVCQEYRRPAADPGVRYRIGTGRHGDALRYRRGMPGFDLHTHSTFSDGTLAPEQVVELATTRSLTGIALTDHDNTGGVEQAQAAARGTGLTVLLGCELSAEHDGNPVHVLGYGFDPDEPAFAAKRAWIAEGRVTRARRMVERVGGPGAPGARRLP